MRAPKINILVVAIINRNKLLSTFINFYISTFT